MSIKSAEKAFEGMSYEDWRSSVEKELRGKAFEDHLVWRSMEGFEIESWQNSVPDNLPTILPLDAPWKIVEPIYESDAREANGRALEALNAGAEAVWFNKSFMGAASSVAGHGIDQAVADVFIEGETHIDIYKPLLKHEGEITITEASVIIDGMRLRERGCSVITEAAMMIASGMDALRRGHKPQSLLFKTGVNSGYFTEIAKIRSIRWIWQSILRNESFEVLNPKLVAINLQTTYAKTDEHSNILRATSSAMSAIIGGAQYVMIEPWNKHWNDIDGFSQRVSRNIQILLKEEGRFDKTLNPADGSYFIENLTLEIAKSIWSRVSEIEQLGGIVSYMKSGKLKKIVEEERSVILKAYQSGKSTLLGITAFQPEQSVKEIKPSVSSYAHLPDYLYLPYELQNQEA